jgi:hypothetical protein
VGFIFEVADDQESAVGAVSTLTIKTQTTCRASSCFSDRNNRHPLSADLKDKSENCGQNDKRNEA